MQLNAVVLPAPLGPISPTISHSSTLRLSPSMAVRPPNLIVRSRTSSTDTGALHRTDTGALVVQVEPVTGEPATDRPDDLAETARVEDDRLQQQHGSDHVGDVELVVAVERAPVHGAGDPAEQRTERAHE